MTVQFQTLSGVQDVAGGMSVGTCRAARLQGTYRHGQRGESSTVPGLQDPYEAPLNPEVRIDTTKVKADEAAEMIMKVGKDRTS